MRCVFGSSLPNAPASGREMLEEGVWGRNLAKVSLPLAQPN
jgi:hypothetical protein